MLRALRKGAEDHSADADRMALQQLAMLMFTGIGCALLVLTFLILASIQAVSMIDAGGRLRETVQVARAINAAPGEINPTTLMAIADTLDLTDARLTTPSFVTADELSVPVPQNGQVVAWRPHLLGSQIFETVALARIGAGIAFVLMLVVVGWRVLVVGRQLDRRRAQAATLANTDTLTGLGNRRAFDEALALRCAAAEAGADSFALVTLDLDGFKAMNDSYGHAMGDAVLQLVGRHLRDASGSGDLLTRLGGDEFAVIRPTAGLDLYLVDLRARMMQPLDFGGRQLHISASFGMARSDDYAGPEQLTRAADRALYRAKRNGPGNIEISTPAPSAAKAA